MPREWEDKPQTGRKYLQKMYLIKDYCPTHTKNAWSSTIRKEKEKWAKDFNRHFKEYTQMANKHMKRSSTSHVIREMQIKTQIPLHTIRMAQIWNIDNDSPKCWWGCGVGETLTHCWWEHKMVQPLWKTVWQFLTKLNILLPYNPAIMFLGIYPKELKTYIYTKTYTWIFYNTFIHNCPNLEATKMSFSRWMDKPTVEHTENA